MQRASQAALAHDRTQLDPRRPVTSAALTVRELIGLTDQELEAVAQVAETLQRRGSLRDAIAVYSQLITCEPLQPRYWLALADLQRRTGQHAIAVACYEMAATLAGRDPEATYRQALSLQQMGHTELAANLLDVALSLAEGQDVEPPWAAEARRAIGELPARG
jgi:tetratricopeptide (TPR) repeat protein